MKLIDSVYAFAASFSLYIFSININLLNSKLWISLIRPNAACLMAC